MVYVSIFQKLKALDYKPPSDKTLFASLINEILNQCNSLKDHDIRCTNLGYYSIATIWNLLRQTQALHCIIITGCILYFLSLNRLDYRDDCFQQSFLTYFSFTSVQVGGNCEATMISCISSNPSETLMGN